MVLILGIDEAGRGSVIGPLVVAGVMIDEKDHEALRDMGVKDSKMLSPEKREELYPLIKKLAKDYVSLKISASEIDKLMKIKNLNLIEADRMARIIKSMKADKAYIDTPQVSTDKFKAVLMALTKTKTKLITENKADVTYPVCSAASIIAKVERDREIEAIKKIAGFDCGVGYSHDAKSIEFVEKFLNHKTFSAYIRHSWATVDDIISKKEQQSLGKY
jgi:ribonuclease HII